MIHYTANLANPLNVSITRNAKEQRSFEYFRTRTAPDLVSCFVSELWSLYVLQLAHNEPAVRHVVIAIGCLHEQFESSTIGPLSDSQFALKQYTKSIQHLIGSFNPCSAQSTDIALLLCALFASFESLQGHYQSALTHIISGMNIIQENQANGAPSPRSHIPARFLGGLFNRLGSQVLEVTDMSIMPLQVLKQSCLEDLPIPVTFSTVEEAQDSFNFFLYRFNHLLSHTEGSTPDGPSLSLAQLEALLASKAFLAQYFECWSAAFDEYLMHRLQVPSAYGHRHAPSAQIEPGVYILQMWREMINVWLSLDLSAGEKAWDPFAQQFRSIIDLAASFLDQSVMSTPCSPGSKPPHSSASAVLTTKSSAQAHEVHQPAANSSPPTFRPLQIIKPTFSLSLGIIAPLYIASSRCRDPAIRRRAIHLLSICNRREGIWDSLLSAHVAQRILEIEETGARQYFRGVARAGSDEDVDLPGITSMLQIPEQVRVVILWTSFGPERQGMVRFKKSTKGSEGLGQREQVDEVHFDW
jgi:hypothetical protein